MSTATAMALRKYSRLCLQATKRLFAPASSVSSNQYGGLSEQQKVLRRFHPSKKGDQDVSKILPNWKKEIFYRAGFELNHVPKPTTLEVVPKTLLASKQFLKDLELGQVTCMAKKGGGEDKKCAELELKKKCAEMKKKKACKGGKKGGKKGKCAKKVNCKEVELKRKCKDLANRSKCKGTKMSRKDKKLKKECQELEAKKQCEKMEAKRKCEEEAAKKKCEEMAAKKKCAEMAKKEKEEKMKKKCQEMEMKKKCKKMADEKKKDGKDGKKC